MSDTGSNDPYDPNRPRQPEQPEQPQPPRPPEEPRWGSNPPPPPEAPQPEPGGWSGGQFGSQQPGPQYGAPGSGGQYGQPYGGQPYGQPGGTPPPNYLVWAILSTVLCCLPLGIPSIVYAARVNAMYAGGDFAGAQDSSRKAKQYAIWSAAIGAAGWIIYFLFIIVAVGAGSS